MVERPHIGEIYPQEEELPALAERGNLTVLVKEMLGDLETPVSAFVKLDGYGPAFLLESVEQGGRTGRYSFVGVDPRAIAIIRGGEALTISEGRAEQLDLTGRDPLSIVEDWLADVEPAFPEGIPSFVGGAVGYVGYDMIRFFEPRLQRTARPAGGFDLPEAVFMLSDTLIAFDHFQRKLFLMATMRLDGDREAAYAAAKARIEGLAERLNRPLPRRETRPAKAQGTLESNMSRDEFEAAVRQAKEYIAAGDIFQVVLSQRLRRWTHVDPFEIYRVLRMINPSPYMFYLSLPDDLRLIGSSPEVLVRLQGTQAEVRPLAGTRPRGMTVERDAALATELLADPKERAEHVMLVDLGRNDLGRVCRYGTVQVPTMMEVERYSHVMHIVSDVVGELEGEQDAFDLLRATFPAGTVSGAPKIRAMEIIDELEPQRRGPYAGAVGYIGFDGNMDMCITIRTIMMKNQVAYVQAGAGIVADSDPGREYQETLHKAQALAEAIEMAEAVERQEDVR
jgi:anthranilate synthase component 1